MLEGFLLVSVEVLLLALCGWKLRRAICSHRAWATFGVWVDRWKRPRVYWTLLATDLGLITLLAVLLAISVKDWLVLK